MSYTYDHFCREMKQKPDMFPKVLSWLEYLSSTFSQRQAKGKSEMEFASVILLTRENDLPAELMQFLIKNVYTAIHDGKSDMVQKTLNQIANTGSPNVVQSTKVLRTVLYLPVQTARGNRSIFSIFSRKKKISEEKASKPHAFSQEQTITSSSGEQTFISSKEDSTIVSSGKPAKDISLDKNFLSAMEHGSGYDAVMVHGRNLSLVQRLTSHWKSDRVKTVLSTESAFEDIELETLRMQTIVSLNKTGPVLAWVRVSKEEELRQCKAENFFRIVQSMAIRDDISPLAKAMFSQLKNSLTIRNKLLTDSQIIPNIIQQGVRSWHHTLDRLSELTNDKKINKKIWEYLQYVSHTRIVEEAEAFRRKFLDCTSGESLDVLLARYNPTRNIVKKYPALGFVTALQKVKACYDRDPGGLIRYMNKYLGAYGEANTKDKLTRLLLTNETDTTVAKEIQKANTLSQILQKLDTLQQRTILAPFVTTLKKLIQTFMDTNQHLGFSSFCTSLNGYSPAIRQKITNIVKQAIQKELNEKITMLLKNSGTSPLNRILDLYKILENTRYHDPMIQLYTYSTKVLLEKLQNIKPNQDPALPQLVKHVISNPLVPTEFLNLVTEGKRAQSRARQA